LSTERLIVESAGAADERDAADNLPEGTPCEAAGCSVRLPEGVYFGSCILKISFSLRIGANETLFSLYT